MDIESLNLWICFLLGMTVFFIWLSFWPENINFLLNRISKDDQFVSHASLKGNGHAVLKMLLPLSQKLAKKSKMKIKKAELDKLDELLVSAGRPFNISAIELFYMKFAGMIYFGILFAIMGTLADISLYMGFLFGIGIGLIFPSYILKGLIKQRGIQADIELPTILELISVCMDSGMTLQNSIQTVCENTEGLLTEEFKMVRADMDRGASALKAFENLTKRCQSKRIYDFYRQVKMNETLGVSIAVALKYQADTIRVETFEIIRQKAAKAASLVLIPVALFILPAIVLIIAGPMVPSFMGQ